MSASRLAAQMFTITRESPKWTERLHYKRAFGIAITESGGDALHNVVFCREPTSKEHAKPGRALLWTASWGNPLSQFMPLKYTRIIARNQDEKYTPQRLVIGSWVDGESDEEKEETALLPKSEQQFARFQSFAVMEDETGIKYGEELSASFDLILRAYKIKTQDAEVTQILSTKYLDDKAVPLLGKEGICLSTLPEKTTWFMTSKNGSDIQMTRELPLSPWKKFQKFLMRSK